jgi:hypothetical protein
MATIQEKLEALFAKVRALPEERQQEAILALTEIAEDDVYVLSDEERAILEPALRDAEQGENLSDAETDELLTKPWR